MRSLLVDFSEDEISNDEDDKVPHCRDVKSSESYFPQFDCDYKETDRSGWYDFGGDLETIFVEAPGNLYCMTYKIAGNEAEGTERIINLSFSYWF